MAPEEITEQPVEEHRVLGHVTARLAEEFPDTHPAVVHEVATRALAGLADARIRDFVEIFVHRDARALLRTYAVQPEAATQSHVPPQPTSSTRQPRNALAHSG